MYTIEARFPGDYHSGTKMLAERLLLRESDGPLGKAIPSGPLCFFEAMLCGEAPAILIRCSRRMITKLAGHA